MSGSHSHHHEHDHPSWQPITLIRKEKIAGSTMAFYFEKPSDLIFKAGQHFTVQLIDPPETDDEGITRHFSLACSPSDKELRIATRMRDTAFKRVLRDMEIGSQVNMGVPHGSYVLHEDTSKPAVFLIGGIGVTPVLSMIKDATERKLPHKLVLLLANTRPENASFLDELSNLAKQNDTFTFVPTMTDPEQGSSWLGRTGYIDQDLIKQHVDNVPKAIFYLSGPIAMVEAMRSLLNELGVSNDSIRTEEFTGY